MLSISSGFNFYLCCEPVTLRYRHSGLRSYIKSQLHCDPTNFLSVIITSRVKNAIVTKGLNKKYSYKQVFRMLSKYKKVRTDKDEQWEDVTRLKYIEELTAILDV